MPDKMAEHDPPLDLTFYVFSRVILLNSKSLDFKHILSAPPPPTSLQILEKYKDATGGQHLKIQDIWKVKRGGEVSLPSPLHLMASTFGGGGISLNDCVERDRERCFSAKMFPPPPDRRKKNKLQSQTMM